MSASRISKEYKVGVECFLNQAVNHYKRSGKIPCPCLRCGDIQRVVIDQIREHLIEFGIDSSYTRWTWHGEIDYVGEKDGDANEDDEDCEDDRLEEMINVVAQDLVYGSLNGFDCLLGDAKKPLYADCSKFRRLSDVLKLYNLKADILPNDNVLPRNNYEAKKILSHMRMCRMIAFYMGKSMPYWKVVQVIRLQGIRRGRYLLEFFGIVQ
ncbi:hypothetical protein V2J09_004427 [Rumex salicifolius]